MTSYSAAADALERALLDGFDPDADPPRAALPAGDGQLLVMPSSATGAVAVKLVTVGPRTPRVRGVCVVFDPETLEVAKVIDGVALTTLRTAAVSLLALRRLARPDARTLAVFGRGPQAQAHEAAVREAFPIERVHVIGRGDDRSPVAEADIVCCCTTAREPLFEADLVEDAAVVAVGSHEPDAREIPGELMRRATVVVESREAALREAGDVVLAGVRELVTLDELVRGAEIPPGPRVFKSVGMAWEDAVVAQCAG